MKAFCKIEIDQTALRYNYNLLTKRIKGKANLLAVIKADGYMHGANTVMQTLQAEGCKWFAVASDFEARHLKGETNQSNVLVLSFPCNLEWCISKGIAFSVSSLCELEQVLR